MRAYKLYHVKRIHENKAIEEKIIWTVPKSKKYPEGVKYRFAYILKPKEKPAVLYDNHYPKGHHQHILGNEKPYRFSSIEQLLKDFDQEIRRF